ncbi:predicted protein [Lodderomyces elongisporus NRRL YB-4239]|uniref:Uncharacterized protein n=1 Tax=Lodderomyces elongisporus (strain ATCC 11503 / CBS 2605 / JCM 1781 / NBRC 1676 / NRRL YB-4239) TaxID=379508 RepID=A5E5G2_LODEL|nr:predicted protein [Lodderomyces elongisporus NRRL YB-4239]
MTIKERVKRVSKIFHTESKESLDKQIAAAGEDKDATITDAPASDTKEATNADADVAVNAPTAAENNNTTTITDAADIPEPTINATEGEVKEVEVKEEEAEEEAAPVAVTAAEPAAAPAAPEATATVPEATATEPGQAQAEAEAKAEAEAEAEESNKATATESTPAVVEKVSRKHDFFRKLYSKFRKPVVAKT